MKVNNIRMNSISSFRENLSSIFLAFLLIAADNNNDDSSSIPQYVYIYIDICMIQRNMLYSVV